ncbi:T9SS type A sorting domain-containing protein [Fluviicola sp.]|uniref:T9SS type A sorting domain-containing protein n=1 Tax=Fluviicola sp. TaxID=1917219 RepID=UPI003D2962AF
MKRILLFSGLSLFCFFGMSQRPLDLELTLTSPTDGATITSEQVFDLIVNVKNVGTGDLETSDSLYYYLLMYGDTMTFAPSNQNHLEYTGNLTHPTESFGISRVMAFSNQFDGVMVDLCIYVKPMNAVDSLFDPNEVNNMDCISVNVVPNDLSVSKNDLETIQLSPNPANNSFNLVGVEENSVVSVMDVQGNMVDFNRDNGDKIDCSTWSNGVYLLKVANANGTSVQKFLVSHE